MEKKNALPFMISLLIMNGHLRSPKIELERIFSKSFRYVLAWPLREERRIACDYHTLKYVIYIKESSVFGAHNKRALGTTGYNNVRSANWPASWLFG